VEDIKTKGLKWADHIIRKEGERIPEKTTGKTKNKMGVRRPEGHVTDLRNKRMEGTSRRPRRMEASSKGGQGPEGAVAP